MRPPDADARQDGARRRLRATIEYDGLEFAGWQRQRERASVQGALEEAIATITGEASKVVGAGRTDAGVHATGQVAHFDTSWSRGTSELLAAINAVLPRSVALRSLLTAPMGFHARHGALSRSYAYRIWVDPLPSPLMRRRSLRVPPPLDRERMAAAAGHLVGTHDFSGFGKPMKPGGVTVRRMERCELRSVRGGLSIEFEANAFLRHQVRRMVGVLLDVGRGRCEPEDVALALAGEPGRIKPRRVPPQGLVLTRVRYPEDEELLR